MSKGLQSLLKTVNKVTKEGKTELPHDVLFLDDFNKALIEIEKEREQPDPPDGFFRPSSMYGCERMLWLGQMHGDSKDKDKYDPNLIGICESGTDRHARIQHVVQNMKRLGFDCIALDVEEEVEKARARGVNTTFIGWNSERTEARCRNDDYSIYFQPDGVILYRGRKYLLEIKTETVFGFQKRVMPKDAHLDFQATCYSAGMGLNNIMFVYECRDNTAKKPYIVSVTDEMRANVLNKIKRVKWYIKTNTCPPMEKDKCTYCKYKTLCKSIGETEAVYVG